MDANRRDCRTGGWGNSDTESSAGESDNTDNARRPDHFSLRVRLRPWLISIRSVRGKHPSELQTLRLQWGRLQRSPCRIQPLQAVLEAASLWPQGLASHERTLCLAFAGVALRVGLLQISNQGFRAVLQAVKVFMAEQLFDVLEVDPQRIISAVPLRRRV